jgi:[ribosomal protein S5]-alanine N-acetyltransferase
MILATERLKLRLITVDDAEFVLQLMNEPSFHKNIGDRGLRTVAQAADYLEKNTFTMYREHGFGLWMVELKTTGERIGICGLLKRPTLDNVDIGFAYMPAHWGKGFALEAASGVLKYGHDNLGLKRIVGIVSPHNAASIRILEKLGMKYEKTITLPPKNDEVLLYGVNAL